jgi:hypothetical protein
MMTAQERKDFRRVQTSRAIWKKRAVSRGEDRRRLRERRQEVERSREAWRDRALAAEDRIAQLEIEHHQLLHAVTPPSPPTTIDNTNFFLSYFYLYIVFHCTLSFRASSKVLRSLLLVGAGLIAWVPHFTTGSGWALRVGLYCLQKAQYPLDAQWVCIADCTMQIGSKKARIVLRVPLSILSQGKALTLQQVEVIGLRLGETWNGERVKTYLLSLFEGCGWPSHVVSDCGSDIKKGIADTLLKAPKTAAWISDITHVVANALKHYYADLSLLQQFQTLCTRIRGRLQQTKFAFLLPPKARAKGRFLSASRQAQWGLQTLAYLEAKEREASPDVSALAQALRGLKSFKLFLMTFVRKTPCLHEVMKMVKTQGLRAESIHACQETLGD